MFDRKESAKEYTDEEILNALIAVMEKGWPSEEELAEIEMPGGSDGERFADAMDRYRARVEKKKQKIRRISLIVAFLLLLGLILWNRLPGVGSYSTAFGVPVTASVYNVCQLGIIQV